MSSTEKKVLKKTEQEIFDEAYKETPELDETGKRDGPVLRTKLIEKVAEYTDLTELFEAKADAIIHRQKNIRGEYDCRQYELPGIQEPLRFRKNKLLEDEDGTARTVFQRPNDTASSGGRGGSKDLMFPWRRGGDGVYFGG